MAYVLTRWQGRRPKSLIVVLLKISWNPRSGQFPYQPGFRAGPIRFLGMVLAGVQIDGAHATAITKIIRSVPAGDSALLVTTTLDALRPVKDYLDQHLR